MESEKHSCSSLFLLYFSLSLSPGKSDADYLKPGKRIRMERERGWKMRRKQDEEPNQSVDSTKVPLC